MTRVIIPARNVRDVKADLPAAVRDALEIIPAERLEQVRISNHPSFGACVSF